MRYLKYIVTLFFGLNVSTLAVSQMNNIWVLGYNQTGVINNTNSIYTIDFRNGQISYDTAIGKAFSLRSNDASICDNLGNLLFYTNGFAIMNALHDTMVNGIDLNPSSSIGSNSWSNIGMPYAQMSIIVPVPGSNTLYYLIHHGWYDLNQWTDDWCDSLFFSVVDMTQDSGRGAVIDKNHPFWTGSYATSDLINFGCLTACKHANGRDWWIVTHKDSTNIFMTFLLTPNGFNGPYFQSIGPVIDFRGPQACFSPDGNKYAIIVNHRPRVFDFDRCTGLFSNHKNLGLFANPATYGSEGIVFSPGSRFLYASADYVVYQWDLNAGNINSTKITVCVYDSLYACPHYVVLFYLMQAAIDGKIYISSPNGSSCLSVINSPDSAGLACNAVPSGLSTLPFYNGSSVPYYPNFYLGAELGSVCDSLTGMNDISNEILNLRIFPNPNNGIFRINYQLQPNKEGLLEIYNTLGETVATKKLSTWSMVHEVNIRNQPSGIYLCRISCGNKSAIVKFVKE